MSATVRQRLCRRNALPTRSRFVRAVPRKNRKRPFQLLARHFTADDMMHRRMRRAKHAITATPIHVLDDGEIDLYELIKAVEKAFGIAIDEDLRNPLPAFGRTATPPDPARVQALLTVGRLHGLVLRKLGLQPPRALLSAPAFYRVRAALMEEFGIPRSAIRPSTPLRELLDRPDPHAWRRFTTRLELGLDAARLARSPRTRRWMLAAALAAGVLVAAAALAVGSLGGCAAVGVGLLAVALAWLAAVLATGPLAVHPPFRTVGDLTRRVFAPEFPARAAQHWNAREREVWDKLVVVVARFYGERPARFLPSTRFIGDVEALDDILIGLGAR